jgi:hypothetical protein
LRLFIVALLRKWETEQALKKLTPDTRTAIPALAEIERIQRSQTLNPLHARR